MKYYALLSNGQIRKFNADDNEQALIKVKELFGSDAVAINLPKAFTKEERKILNNSLKQIKEVLSNE